MDGNELLKRARLQAGYASAAAAARAFGWKVGTYGGHENGHRSITPEAAYRYAKAFGVPPASLLRRADDDLSADMPAIDLAVERNLQGLVSAVLHAGGNPFPSTLREPRFESGEEGDARKKKMLGALRVGFYPSGPETTTEPPLEGPAEQRLAGVIAALVDEYIQKNEHERETLEARFWAHFPELRHKAENLWGRPTEDIDPRPGSKFWESFVPNPFSVPVRILGRMRRDSFATPAAIVNLDVAAETESLSNDELPSGKSWFNRAWFQYLGLHRDNCALTLVRDESMEPEFPAGCAVLFDRGLVDPEEGRVYVVRMSDGRLAIRRALSTEAGWELAADKEEAGEVFPWPPLQDVVGGVVWSGRTYIESPWQKRRGLSRMPDEQETV